MGKPKVIFILPHLPYELGLVGKRPEEIFINEEIGTWSVADCRFGWVGFFNADHHVQSALALKKQTDEFTIECWRPYGYGLKQMVSAECLGITHRVFSAKKTNYPKLGSMTWSEELFEFLKKQLDANEKIILNITVGHAWFHMRLLFLLKTYKSRLPIVAVHRSGGFRCISYQQFPLWKKLFKWNYLIESWFDRRSLAIVDTYFVGTNLEVEYIRSKKWPIHAVFHMDGVDFKQYVTRSESEKMSLRVKLNLPVNKNLFIVSGNWSSKDYAYKTLLDVYREIKDSGQAENLQLVMVGGSKGEDLYELGLQVGAIMIEKTSKSNFISCLEASDFYGQPNLEFGFIMFGGFGVAMIEALACGMPVISNNIIHFPGNVSERKELGLDCMTASSLRESILHLNTHHKQYRKTRDISMKYYDISKTENTLLTEYRRLRDKYFNA